MFSELTGVVAEFDDPRGLGVVETVDGGRHTFHCTAIADGSRRIAVGTQVSFRLVAGHAGEWEAGEVAPMNRSAAQSL